MRSAILAAGAGRLRRWLVALAAVAPTAALVIVGGVAGTPAASAAQSTIDLGTASSFAVLAGSTVTNTGNTVINGNLGVSPGTAITGFPPGTINNGTEYTPTVGATGVAAGAQSDLGTAYGQAASAPSTGDVTGEDLGETPGFTTLGPGVYTASSSMAVDGTLTLTGDASSVFIFQAGSSLLVGQSDAASVVLDGVQACHVFWQVTSSATLYSTSTTGIFAGSILALTSATLDTGVNVAGRVLARNAAVTLDDNDISVPMCNSTTTTAPSASLVTLGNSVDDVATVTGNATDGTPTGSVQFYQCGPPSILCSSTSGTALGPAEALSGGVATSASFTPSAVGTYCFASVYTPSAGSAYAGSSEAGSTTNGECFTVTASADTPTNITVALPGSGTVSSGGPSGALAITGLFITRLLAVAFVMVMVGIFLLVFARGYRRHSRV